MEMHNKQRTVGAGSRKKEKGNPVSQGVGKGCNCFRTQWDCSDTFLHDMDMVFLIGYVIVCHLPC